MTLENQVCSLELAKKLKELGIQQHSAFWWEQDKVAGRNEWSKEWKCLFNNGSKPYSDSHVISAFTVAELGEMLPECFLWQTVTQVALTCAKYSGGWHVRYASTRFQGKREIDHFEDGKTEADARAKMLIYLLENNLLTPKGEPSIDSPTTP